MSAGEHHAPNSCNSATGTAKRAKCPLCGKPRSRDYRPFCSKHCADIDLGRWLGGRYVVPGAPVAEDPQARGDGGRDDD